MKLDIQFFYFGLSALSLVIAGLPIFSASTTQSAVIQSAPNIHSAFDSGTPESKLLTSDEIYWMVLRAIQRTVADAEVDWKPGQGDRAYRIIYGGGELSSLATFSDHVVCAGAYCSSAKGAYQFMPPTWEGLKKKHLSWYPGDEFSPENQDLAFFRLFDEIGSWQRLIKGIRVEAQVVTVDEHAVRDAISNAASTWCGLPGDERRLCTGQPQRDWPETLSRFYEELAVEQR